MALIAILVFSRRKIDFDWNFFFKAPKTEVLSTDQKKFEVDITYRSQAMLHMLLLNRLYAEVSCRLTFVCRRLHMLYGFLAAPQSRVYFFSFSKLNLARLCLRLYNLEKKIQLG